MVSAGDWQSLLGDLLGAVPRDVDRFVLELLTQHDTDGGLFKDHLPDDALHHMNDEYGDYWWVNTGAEQGNAWISHRWRVLRADSSSLTITFARLV